MTTTINVQKSKSPWDVPVEYVFLVFICFGVEIFPPLSPLRVRQNKVSKRGIDNRRQSEYVRQVCFFLSLIIFIDRLYKVCMYKYDHKKKYQV